MSASAFVGRLVIQGWSPLHACSLMLHQLISGRDLIPLPRSLMPAVLKVAFLLWLFDFLIFEQFWWNSEGSKGLAQDLPGGKDNIGCQGEEIGEEAGSLCGCLSCGAPRRVEALEERMPGEGEKV